MRLMESSTEDPNSFRVESQKVITEKKLNGDIMERSLEYAEPDESENKIHEVNEDIRLTPSTNKMPSLPKLPKVQGRQPIVSHDRSQE